MTQHLPVAMNYTSELSSFQWKTLFFEQFKKKNMALNWITCFSLKLGLFIFSKYKGESQCVFSVTSFMYILLQEPPDSKITELLTHCPANAGKLSSREFLWSWAQLSNCLKLLYCRTVEWRLTGGSGLQCQTHFIQTRCEIGSPGLQLKCIGLFLRESNAFQPHGIFFKAIILIYTGFSHDTSWCWLQ